MRKISFRCDLLDLVGRRLRQVDFTNGSVSYDADRPIKRTLRMSAPESFNPLEHRLRVVCSVDEGQGWQDYPLGVFLPTTPPREHDGAVVMVNIEGYDLSQILADDRIPERFMVPEGASYVSAARELLEGVGLFRIQAAYSPLLVDVAREWEIGTSKLRIVNDLMAAINYEDVHFSAEGVARLVPYVPAHGRAPNLSYVTDVESTVLRGARQDINLFSVPNRWIVTRSHPERPPLTVVITNDSPDSITSTVSRGRTISSFHEVDDVADFAALQGVAERIAIEGSRVFERVEFRTMIKPMHGHRDVLALRFDELSLSGNYEETSWEIPLKTGGEMFHRARRVVQL